MDASHHLLSDEDRALVDSGYTPQLKRRLTSFASFAAVFSIMSILMGVYATYGFALTTAGPFSIWTWPVVALGQLLVALIFAELAARLPLAGSLYNWNYRLSNPVMGWQAGWLTALSYAVATVGLIVAMMPPIESLLGHDMNLGIIQCVGVGIILAQLVISIYGVQFAGLINRYAVIAEFFAVIVFGGALALVATLKGGIHTSLLTTPPKTPVPYLPAFIVSGLLGAWTIFGFETAADISEETLHAKRIAPKSVLWAVGSSSILGFLFILVLTLAIPDATAIASTADPVSSILFFYLGNLATRFFLVFVLIAMFATGLMCMINSARVTFAIARDKKTLGSSLLNRVSRRYVPANASIFIALIEIVVFFVAYGQASLYAAEIILLSLVYLITIVNFAFYMKKLPPADTFSLGKFRLPIIVLSTSWLIFEIGVFTLPQQFRLAVYISVVIILAGMILQFLLTGPFRKIFSTSSL